MESKPASTHASWPCESDYLIYIAMMNKNVLFICGSLNQTMMMHQISTSMPGCNSYFTPFFADGFLGWLAKIGLLNFTILGGSHRDNTLEYIRKNNLPLDENGKARKYDLIVTCTDLITQKIFRDTPMVLVQEGIMEDETWMYSLIKYLKLPRYLANTAATGLSDQYEYFFVASEGYRDFFIRKGVKPHKMIVTGIPNFDNVEVWRENNFPFRDYILVATSSARETFKPDNRIAFLKNVKKIAGDTPIILKLHPNENKKRAIFEITRILPEALILTEGNIYPMIANCAVLITQYSTVTLVGLLLGKKVYSYLDLEAIKKLLPLQNGGKSGQQIASICMDLLNKQSLKKESINLKLQAKPKFNYFRELR